jgi:hypothetical protein
MTELEIIEGLKNKNLNALKQMVSLYSAEMTDLAYLLLKRDREKARQTVDDILLRFLRPDEAYNMTLPLQSYLMNEVRRACGLDE